MLDEKDDDVSSNIDVSIVIVNYNTKDITGNCIQSVLDHTNSGKTQIIVVDNASSDGSAEDFKKRFPEIQVIASPINAGFAFGNDVGFRLCKGRYILLLNPDTVITDDSIAQCAAYLDENPDVGILGPRVRFETGEHQSSMFRFPRLTHLFFNCFIPYRIMRKTRLFGDIRYAGLNRDTAHDVEIVTGCFMMVRREALEQAGELDHRFFMYSEESEWCYRILNKGWKIRYNPDFEIIHIGEASTENMSTWKAIEIARGHILFLRFTRGPVIAYLGLIMILMRDVLRSIIFLPRMLLGKKDEMDLVWKARLCFLTKSLVSPPRGQTVSMTPEEISRL